jgi:DNA-binding transcriptional MerR regulator
MTVDELARRAGMTVRNVRAHQTRGLLPPPRVVSRTGYYGPEHLARLRLIRDMQAAGFNLAAIRRLLDAAPPGAGEELLLFERALMGPWGPEEPEVIESQVLLEIFGPQSEGLLDRAADLGLLVPLDDGRFEVTMPTLLRAGREMADLGVPLERMLDAVEGILRHAGGVANEFVRLFVDGVWRPFEEAGEPPDRWPRVRQALERLRPLASQALVAAFQRTMERAVEGAFGRELDRRLTGRQGAAG